jgi:hypothetical protein
MSDPPRQDRRTQPPADAERAQERDATAAYGRARHLDVVQPLAGRLSPALGNYKLGGGLEALLLHGAVRHPLVAEKIPEPAAGGVVLEQARHLDGFPRQHPHFRQPGRMPGLLPIHQGLLRHLPRHEQLPCLLQHMHEVDRMSVILPSRAVAGALAAAWCASEPPCTRHHHTAQHSLLSTRSPPRSENQESHHTPAPCFGVKLRLSEARPCTCNHRPDQQCTPPCPVQRHF